MEPIDETVGPLVAGRLPNISELLVFRLVDLMKKTTTLGMPRW